MTQYLHAYRIRVYPEELPDITELLDLRSRVSELIRQFGDDPLAAQQITARVTTDLVVIIEWRLRDIGPDRQELVDIMVDVAEALSSISRWEIHHHLCGNGLRRPCKPWHLLKQGDNS